MDSRLLRVVAVLAFACAGRFVVAQGNADAAKIKNPVKSSAESIEAGKTTYNKYCKFCHNEGGTGNGALAPKDTHPPSLIDATWDHGSTDGEIFTNIKNGVAPEFNMVPFKDKLKDDDIWNVVNYIRSIKK